MVIKTILAISAIYFCQFAASQSPFDYCSFENDQNFKNARAIPQRKSGPANLELQQVHMMMRHGARTPDNPDANSCFPNQQGNYHIWNCEYTEVFNGVLYDSDYETWPFNVVYDSQPKDNELGGTCYKGQLITEAFSQTQTIADSLYEAYFNSSDFIRLTDLSENPKMMYIRSTDIQRTKHSAAQVITRLFKHMEEEQGVSAPEMMEIHLMDLDRETMVSFEYTCPNVVELSTAAYSSPEYYQMVSKNQELYNQITTITGIDTGYDNVAWAIPFIDCYFSALCNDLQDYIPDEFKMTNETTESDLPFQLYAALNEETNFLANYNYGMISKCMANDMIYDFMQGWKVEEMSDPHYEPQRNSKFLVYSAHDATILFFLSAMGVHDGIWPSYSSLVTFEHYSDPDHNSYFRVVYNGGDITERFATCKDHPMFQSDGVCPTSMLMEATKWVSYEAFTPAPKTCPTPPPDQCDDNKQGSGDDNKQGSGDDNKQGNGDDNKQGSGDDNQGNGDDNQGNGDDNKQGSGDDNKQGSGDDNKQGSGDDNQGNGDDNQGNGDDNQGNGDDDQGNGDDNTVEKSGTQIDGVSIVIGFVIGAFLSCAAFFMYSQYNSINKRNRTTSMAA